MVSIVLISYLPVGISVMLTSTKQIPPAMKSNHLNKNMNQVHTKKNSAIGKSSNYTPRGVLDVLGCVAKRWSLYEGQWSQCYEVFLAYWNSVGYLQDYEMSGI